MSRVLNLGCMFSPLCATGAGSIGAKHLLIADLGADRSAPRAPWQSWWSVSDRFTEGDMEHAAPISSGDRPESSHQRRSISEFTARAKQLENRLTLPRRRLLRINKVVHSRSSMAPVRRQ